jgi:hypothetical protein
VCESVECADKVAPIIVSTNHCLFLHFTLLLQRLMKIDDNYSSLLAAETFRKLFKAISR